MVQISGNEFLEKSNPMYDHRIVLSRDILENHEGHRTVFEMLGKHYSKPYITVRDVELLLERAGHISAPSHLFINYNVLRSRNDPEGSFLSNDHTGTSNYLWILDGELVIITAAGIGPYNHGKNIPTHDKEAIYKFGRIKNQDMQKLISGDWIDDRCSGLKDYPIFKSLDEMLEATSDDNFRIQNPIYVVIRKNADQLLKRGRIEYNSNDEASRDPELLANSYGVKLAGEYVFYTAPLTRVYNPPFFEDHMKELKELDGDALATRVCLGPSVCGVFYDVYGWFTSNVATIGISPDSLIARKNLAKIDED